VVRQLVQPLGQKAAFGRRQGQAFLVAQRFSQRHGAAGLRAQFLGRDREYLFPGADGHKMAGSFDGMPYRTRHCVGHRLVDGIRYQAIVQSLPQVNWTLNLTTSKAQLR
jgi:hypothetical protein